MGESGKIYLFRHGRTDFNELGKFTGWKDSKLTPSGIKDAKKIAEKLKNKKFEVAIHTKLSRSKDTLKYVLKYHPECKLLILDDRMIERSYGVLEGKKHDWFIKKVGEQVLKLKEYGDSWMDLENKRNIQKIKNFFGKREYEAIHRGYKVKVPYGESFYDVEKRVKNFIKWLKKYVKKNKVNVAISAHGNSIRLFRKIVENANVEEMVKWVIPFDKVYVYDLNQFRLKPIGRSLIK